MFVQMTSRFVNGIRRYDFYYMWFFSDIYDIVYSVLFHNLRRSAGHHSWLSNNAFSPCPVLSCPSWAGKLYTCPLVYIVFLPLLLSVSSIDYYDINVFTLFFIIFLQSGQTETSFPHIIQNRWCAHGRKRQLASLSLQPWHFTTLRNFSVSSKISSNVSGSLTKMSAE